VTVSTGVRTSVCTVSSCNVPSATPRLSQGILLFPQKLRHVGRCCGVVNEGLRSMFNADCVTYHLFLIHRGFTYSRGPCVCALFQPSRTCQYFVIIGRLCLRRFEEGRTCLYQVVGDNLLLVTAECRIERWPFALCLRPEAEFAPSFDLCPVHSKSAEF